MNFFQGKVSRKQRFNKKNYYFELIRSDILKNSNIVTKKFFLYRGVHKRGNALWAEPFSHWINNKSFKSGILYGFLTLLETCSMPVYLYQTPTP